MTIQDDMREIEMCNLFGLTKGFERGGTDATLSIGDTCVEFELKSVTKKVVLTAEGVVQKDGAFSTVRDLGPDHIAKWRNGRHWLLARYQAALSRKAR